MLTLSEHLKNSTIDWFNAPYNKSRIISIYEIKKNVEEYNQNINDLTETMETKQNYKIMEFLFWNVRIISMR